MTDEKHDMLERQEESSKVVPFEKGEETKENPEGGETPEKKAPVSEQETEENKPEVAEKRVTQKELDKVYARMKAAEEEAKKVKEELTKKSAPVSDTDAILEVQQATKGLSPEEVAELQLRAKANKVSLLEARKDENFKLWQDGMKAKVEKEKALNPSTTQSEVEEQKKKSIDQRLQEAKTQEDKEKILNELTYKDPLTGGTEKGLNPIKSRNI